jgi:hypothetical protein
MAALSSALLRRLDRLLFDPVACRVHPRTLDFLVAKLNPVGEGFLLFAGTDPDDLAVGQD